MNHRSLGYNCLPCSAPYFRHIPLHMYPKPNVFLLAIFAYLNITEMHLGAVITRFHLSRYYIRHHDNNVISEPDFRIAKDTPYLALVITAYFLNHPLQMYRFLLENALEKKTNTYLMSEDQIIEDALCRFNWVMFDHIWLHAIFCFVILCLLFPV